MRRNFRNILLLKNKSIKENLFKLTVFSDSHINTEAVDDETYPNLSSPPMYYYTARKKVEDVVGYVNENKPNVLLCLGDVIDGENWDSSFDMFMSYWDTVDISIKKAISAGNHDYYYKIPDDPVHEYVAGKLGYGERAYVAGSKMQESFAVYHSIHDRSFGVRFINLDTNITAEGTFNGVGSYISTEVLNWIENELLNCPENLAFIFSHKGRNFLEEQSRIGLETTIANVLNGRPEMKIYRLYGHTHRPSIWKYNSDIGGFPIYNVSALVDNLESEFYTLYISEAGVHSIETHWAKY